MTLVLKCMVRGGPGILGRAGERSKGTRACSYLDLGPSEADPETRIGWPLTYLEDEPRKLGRGGEERKTGKETRT